MKIIYDPMPEMYDFANGWQDVNTFNGKKKIVGHYLIVKKEKHITGPEYWIQCIKEIFAFLTCGVIVKIPKQYFSNRLVVKLGIPYLKNHVDEIFDNFTFSSDRNRNSTDLIALFKWGINECSKKIESSLPRDYHFNYQSYKLQHRCCDIFCPQSTSIRLEGMREDYFLHANQISIDNSYAIATQYPLNSNSGFYWFWMAVITRGSLIVDLSNENDMSASNMVRYYPTSKEAEYEFSGLKVKFDQIESIQEMENTFLCKYNVSIGSQTRVIDQIQMKSWPDKKGTDVGSLIKLVKLIRNYQADKNICPVIHCRAGVGRSGTVITILNAVQLILDGKITKDNLLQELTRLILAGRYQRSFVFVQTSDQFEAIVRVCEAILDDNSLI